ncbi:MerR family transcriptional regulator [Pseudonocardia sp. ICBG1122]|nr:MerR family transcriptional regulator [Pseudonocardia pini]NWJ69631.1 MerR family transcriptional regulator [Pseudonocardia pini]
MVGTGAAAAAVGVDPATLWRWERAGRVKAELRTAGGQLRWDIDRLRAQLRVGDDPATEAGQ